MLDGKQSLQKHQISTGVNYPTVKNFSYNFFFWLLQSWPQFDTLVFINIQYWYLLLRILFPFYFKMFLGWE